MSDLEAQLAAEAAQREAERQARDAAAAQALRDAQAALDQAHRLSRAERVRQGKERAAAERASTAARWKRALTACTCDDRRSPRHHHYIECPSYNKE